MKNIHILSTDKPSRLWVNNLLQGKLELSKEVLPYNTSRNIHITSDEEIKEGDWYISILENEVYKATKETQNIMSVANLIGTTTYKNTHFKIILTTDVDLIKDGVQAIDDEFLNWFVKNPSCDFVMTIPDVRGLRDIFQPTGKDLYKIIIPKEEPKQELEKEMFELEQELDIPSHLRWHNSKPKLETIKEGGKINPLLMDEIGQFKFLPKQETTSEGFHRISKEFDYSEFDFVSFKIGTEWQQEQFSKSEFIQLVRATKSDAEVRRIIREYFK